jgi:purine-nucleoside phosphorylase
MISKDTYVHHVQEAVLFIQKQYKKKKFSPVVALVLGSGLNKLATLIDPVATLSYKHIPHFPVSTVPGHEGKMILGFLEGVPVIGLQGRKHYYEVATEPRPMDIVTCAVHVAASLGCKLYCHQRRRRVNPSYKIGDLGHTVSYDCFNLIRFQDHTMTLATICFFSLKHTILPKSWKFRCIDTSIHEKLYVALTGRTYETQAECLMHARSALIAGMSAVPK